MLDIEIKLFHFFIPTYFQFFIHLNSSYLWYSKYNVDCVILQIGSGSFKVLHLSDTHFDPYYEEGTNAACNEPLCCRLTNGPAKNVADKAGRWGDYRRCDTPKRTIDHMFQHISSTHPVCFTLYGETLDMIDGVIIHVRRLGYRLYSVDRWFTSARYLESNSGGKFKHTETNGEPNEYAVSRYSYISGFRKSRICSCK